MKLHDTQSPDQAICESQYWELIPWYVNESLPEDEAAELAAHVAGCEACQAELRRQKTLAKEVATADPFEEPRARSWEVLQSQIAADQRARQPQRQGWGGFANAHKGLIAMLGAVACACVVLVVQFDTLPQGEGFQTLTSAEGIGGPTIKFQAAPGTTMAQLETLLSAQGATLTSGPTDQGIYTAAVAEGINVAAVADVLMSAPQIMFAAPESE